MRAAGNNATSRRMKELALPERPSRDSGVCHSCDFEVLPGGSYVGTWSGARQEEAPGSSPGASRALVRGPGHRPELSVPPPTPPSLQSAQEPEVSSKQEPLPRSAPPSPSRSAWLTSTLPESSDHSRPHSSPEHPG